MKLPNSECAVIAPDKIIDYLLNIEHKRGGAKARLLIQFGYRAEDWQQLETDIRLYHVNARLLRCDKRCMECVTTFTLRYKHQVGGL